MKASTILKKYYPMNHQALAGAKLDGSYEHITHSTNPITGELSYLRVDTLTLMSTVDIGSGSVYCEIRDLADPDHYEIDEGVLDRFEFSAETAFTNYLMILEERGL